MRKVVMLIVLMLSGCASHEDRQPPCPQPRAMNTAPQRNSVVLQRENLIPVHVSYVQLPFIDAGSVLMYGGGEHVLYRGTPPDNRATVAQIEPPPPPSPVAAVTPPPAPAQPPVKPKVRPKSVWKPKDKRGPMCSCAADQAAAGSAPKSKPEPAATAQPSATSPAAVPITPAATAPPKAPVTFQPPPPGPTAPAPVAPKN